MVAMLRCEGRVVQVLRFTWHFVQMFIAMAVGMALLGFGVGLLGYADLGKRQPEVYALLMAVSMVIPMAAWMRFWMGHAWSRTTEMSAAMIFPILALVGICSVGLLPHTVALSWSMPVMYVAMLGIMAYRWRDYAQHRHSQIAESSHIEHEVAGAVRAPAR
jgi:hypothetical protein